MNSMAKINRAASLLREVSVELGYTVRLSSRVPDQFIPRQTYGVMIEGDLPNGHVYGTGDTADKAFGEALARLADVTEQKAAA